MTRLRQHAKSHLVQLIGWLRAAGVAILLFACAVPALAQDVAPAETQGHSAALVTKSPEQLLQDRLGIRSKSQCGHDPPLRSLDEPI